MKTSVMSAFIMAVFIDIIHLAVEDIWLYCLVTVCKSQWEMKYRNNSLDILLCWPMQL